MTTLGILLFVVCSLILGYGLGSSRKKMLNKTTNELPNELMVVISTDKTSTVLEEVSVKRNRYLVSTEVFGGRAIRPKDVVRKIKNETERKNLGIPILGYPALVKDVFK